MKERYLGKIQITAELIESILKVDKDLNLIGTMFDPARKIATFVFESSEAVEGQTWLVPEGHEAPNFIPEGLIKEVREDA